MAERPQAVSFQGRPLTLAGSWVGEGDRAPDCPVVNNDLEEVRLADWDDRVRVIATVPSLDTPVCEVETRRFNSEAADLGADVVILTVSMDLPFAQQRWCAAQEVERVITLSDHREAAVGWAYGVLIKELRLLARAVFVVDKTGTVRHAQLVADLGQEPDYPAVLEAVRRCE
jgi:thiol peroxidase